LSQTTIQFRSAATPQRRAARPDGLRDSLSDPLAGPPLAPVQFLGGGDAGAGTHAVAEQGLAGPAQALPHGEAIQSSFGDHDVSGISAHVGGAAHDANARLGASAYASGDHVGFRDSPDLHTAAHEAAHVVQQRGGVHLKGGIGAKGDPHERHADAVADAVVRGESAEGLLDTYGGGTSGPSAVQFDKLDELTDLKEMKAHADTFLTNLRKGCTDPLVKKMLGGNLETLVQFRKDMDQYGENQFWGFLDEERKLTRGGKESLWNQALAVFGVHKEMTTKTEGASDVVQQIESVVSKELDAEALSFATAEQIESARVARLALAPILQGHKDRLAPLSQAKSTLETTPENPTFEDVTVAKTAVSTFDGAEAPPAHGDHLGALKSVLNDLSVTGLRDKKKAIYLAAVNDPDKKLDADETTCGGYAANMRGKTKTEVEADITERLRVQHEPDKGIWLETMGLDTPAENLWLKASVGDVDGTNVHGSLFKEQLPSKASVKTALAPLKLELLGSGATGLHVTLEHFGAHGGGPGKKNPHAYRGGLVIQNNYPASPPDKSDWATTKGKLEGFRNALVTDAEKKITDFKTVLGRRKFV